MITVDSNIYGEKYGERHKRENRKSWANKVRCDVWGKEEVRERNMKSK